MSDEAARLEGIIAIVGAEKGETQIRKVAVAADKGQTALKGVEDAAKAAGKATDKLGTESAKAAKDVDKLGDQAKQTSTQTEKLGTSSKQSGDSVEGMGRKSRRVKDDIDGLAKSQERTRRSTKDLGETFVTAGTHTQRLGRNVTLAAAPLTAIAGLSFNNFANFDLTIRQAGTVSDASAKQMDGMRQTAIKLGKDTSFSANEAATAMLELAKGGISQAQMGAGVLDQTLTLAAAGGLQLGEAAGYMTNTLNAFGLKATAAGGVAAALAGGANASTASVQSLGMGLAQTGRSAVDAGMGLNETIGALALFENAGVKGSDAGTSLKTMLTRLVPQTDEAADAMKKLGLNFTDAQGNMLPMRNVAQQLQSKLKGLSESQRISALNTIFGADASRAAGIMADAGAAGIDKMVAATKDLNAAQLLAKTNTDGAKGSIEQMKGSVETASIQFGQVLSPHIVAAAGQLGDLADGFSNLTSGQQSAALGMGTFAVATGPALIAAGSLVRSYGEVKKAAQASRVASQFAALALNPYAVGAVALGAAVIGVVAAVRHHRDEAAKEAEETRQHGVVLAAATERRRAAALTLESATKRTKVATDNVAKAEEAYGKKSPEYKAAVEVKTKATQAQAKAQKDLNKAVEDAKDEGTAADGKGENGGKDKTISEQVRDTKTLIETEQKLADERKNRIGVRDAYLKERDPSIKPKPKYEGSKEYAGPESAAATIDRVTAAMKRLKQEQGQGKTVGDAYVHQASQLQSELDAANQVLNETATAMDRADKKVRNLTLDQAKMAMATADAGDKTKVAQGYIKSLTNTPGNLRAAKDFLGSMTTMQLKAAFGTTDINQVLSAIMGQPVDPMLKNSFLSEMAAMRREAANPVTVTVTRITRSIATSSKANGVDTGPFKPFTGVGKATGGSVHGPGTGTSDEIPAWLSNGEHVWTAAEVRAAGGHGQIEKWRKMALHGDLPAFKAGGAVVYAQVMRGGKKVTVDVKKLTAAEKAARANEVATTVNSDLANASFAANDSDDALKTKRETARTNLAGWVTSEREAMENLPSARTAVRTTGDAVRKAQKAYDAITGTDATDRRKKYKNKVLDPAKKAAKDAAERLAKLVDTASTAKDKRAQLASDIQSFSETLGDRDTESAREDEDLRREALGLESVDEEKHRLALNVKRKAAGLPEIGPQAAGQSADLEARLAQEKTRADNASTDLRNQTAAFSVFNGSNDIGTGGGALAQASGGMQLHFHSVLPTTAQQAASVADMALQGGTHNGYAAAAYAPVQQIGA